MKTVLSLLLFLSLSVFTIHCQQDNILTNKNNRVILPEKNDIAIGFSTNTIFNYIGNLFNNSENNSLNLKLLDNSQLFLKYYLTKNTAVNVRLGITMTNREILYNTDYSEYIIDEEYSQLKFSAGYEKRRGLTRLQLVYGGELNFFFNDVNYWGDIPPGAGFIPPKRTMPNEIELRGFAGIEYFLAPKISVGGQCGLGLSNKGFLQKQVPDKVVLNTDNFGGQIYMLFHIGM